MIAHPNTRAHTLVRMHTHTASVTGSWRLCGRAWAGLVTPVFARLRPACVQLLGWAGQLCLRPLHSLPGRSCSGFPEREQQRLCGKGSK